MIQLRPYVHSLRRAYGLNTSEALGYAPEEDLSDLNTLIVNIDYQKDFLEVSFTSVDRVCDIQEGIFRIDDFVGGNNSASVSNLCPRLIYSRKSPKLTFHSAPKNSAC